MRGSRGTTCPPSPRGSCSTQRGGRGREGGTEPPRPRRPPPVPGPTWRELGRSKRRERSSTRPVVVPRGAGGAPLALPPRPVPGATGAETAMVPPTLAVRCLCWALLLPGHGPAQIFEWPRAAGQPLVTPHPHWGLPAPLQGIHRASMRQPVPGCHRLPPATAPDRVPRGQLRSTAG